MFSYKPGWYSEDGEVWHSLSPDADKHIQRAIKEVHDGYKRYKRIHLSIKPRLIAWLSKKVHRLCVWLDPFEEGKPGRIKEAINPKEQKRD